MYPAVNCHDQSYGIAYLYQDGNYITGAYMMDWADFSFFNFDTLEAGTYTIKF